MMQAIVYEKYGPPDVLQLKDVERPTPRDNEVLVRVRAASVNKADWYMLNGKPFMIRLNPGGIRAPRNKILGADMAGHVEAVGSDVEQFKAGDRVFGDISSAGMGAFAEYVSVPEELLAPAPSNLSLEEIAAIPTAGVTALQGIRDAGEIEPGQRVLINGASGGVGTYAVQIAKAYGTDVTAVCSTRNMDLVRSIGADHVIDYTSEDFTRNGQRYDLIIGVNGYHSLSDYSSALAPTGTYVCLGGTMRHIFGSLLLGPVMTRKGGKKIGNMGMVTMNQRGLAEMKELCEAGKVVPAIDKRYPLAEASEALRYFGEGHARGKVVLTVEQSAQ